MMMMQRIDDTNSLDFAAGLRDHPYITSAKGLGGWLVSKMVIFADVQHCIHAVIMDGSEKVQKYADVIKGWSLSIFSDFFILPKWMVSPCWSVLDFWKINLEKSSSINWSFTACVACKNQSRNWFLQAKNPVCRTGFLKLDYSKNQVQISKGIDSKKYLQSLQEVPWLL